MVLITKVTGAYKPTYNWGGHIVVFFLIGHQLVNASGRFFFCNFALTIFYGHFLWDTMIMVYNVPFSIPLTSVFPTTNPYQAQTRNNILVGGFNPPEKF